ncbi:unnamed protein product [Acanthoscelides obtectus]|uniref:Uncharacterized protein n=1 Tax=Acanthoscelides obtectus TaxID=200917 RepID=A0A9P0P4E1_ACAOB|nr:unnamed protein product [Acanthoscelides obtectus]CAK1633520.1 hypothetical protein AOBTE_LOCUS8190 [Acanthoscelides obtectus]
MNNSDLLSVILLEEEEEDEWLQLKLLEKQRCEKHDIFQKRTEEGFFSLLINGHLKEDEKKFREFFRLNPEQFDFVVTHTRGYRKAWNELCKVSNNSRGKAGANFKFVFRQYYPTQSQPDEKIHSVVHLVDIDLYPKNVNLIYRQSN